MNPNEVTTKTAFIKYFENNQAIPFFRIEGSNTFVRVIDDDLMFLMFESNPSRGEFVVFALPEIFESKVLITISSDNRRDAVVFEPSEIEKDKGCRNCVKNSINNLFKKSAIEILNL